MAEEQQGDRSALERLSSEPHQLRVLPPGDEIPGSGQNGRAGTATLRNGAEVRDFLGPVRAGAHCQGRSKC